MSVVLSIEKEWHQAWNNLYDDPARLCLFDTTLSIQKPFSESTHKVYSVKCEPHNINPHKNLIKKNLIIYQNFFPI